MLCLPDFPPHMRQAADRQKGQNWIIEILIFFLVYMVASTAMSFVLLAGLILKIITDRDFLGQFTTLMRSARAEQFAQQVTDAILGSDFFILIMLFANAAIIATAILFCVILQKRSALSMGFSRVNILKSYGTGAAAGFFMISLAVLVSVLTGALKINGISENFSLFTFLLFAAGFGIQGMAEEVLCRGYFMVSLGRRYPVAAAVVINSGIFALLHVLNPGVSVLSILNIFLIGIFFSLYFLRTGNIWGVGALHSVWNFAQGNIFGLEVSGMDISCTLFASSAEPSKALINGGVFGAEGGILTTLAALAAILLVLIRKKPDAQST